MIIQFNEISNYRASQSQLPWMLFYHWNQEKRVPTDEEILDLLYQKYLVDLTMEYDGFNLVIVSKYNNMKFLVTPIFCSYGPEDYRGVRPIIGEHDVFDGLFDTNKWYEYRPQHLSDLFYGVLNNEQTQSI